MLAAPPHSPVLTQCGCYSAVGSSASSAVGNHPTCEYHCLRNPQYQTDPVDTQRTAVNGRYRQDCLLQAGAQVLHSYAYMIVLLFCRNHFIEVYCHVLIAALEFMLCNSREIVLRTLHAHACHEIRAASRTWLST